MRKIKSTSQRLKPIIKNLAARVLCMTGLASYHIKKRSKGRALILSYHHVIPRKKIEEGNVMPGMYLSSEAFERGIGWLKKNFTLVSLEEIIEKIDSGIPWKDQLCAITFDDGWDDVYTYAFPILKKNDVPATVFLVGGLARSDRLNCFDSCFELALRCKDERVKISGVEEIDAIIWNREITDKREKARRAIHTLRSLPYDTFMLACNDLTRYFESHFDVASLKDKYKMLSTDNMKKMGKEKIDFGYHSKNHYMLTQVPDSILDDELIIPTEEYLSAGINLKPLFCYPDGKYNEKIISALKKHKYGGAVSLRKGYNNCNTDLFALRRVNIHEGNAGRLSLFLATIGVLNK
ncbi:MAG: polysaccharide deacetylase family protein [Deltaproteobacteria bacterium]|nr:polysaccharide deacetylase family protein [Deltaproteobacteria bacterium]